ncbi:hypothetical protein [Rhodoglobus aureus]|uniref:Fido domain-containing protein n=1 Tax=Rhodoglobus aureus TaxID=191497 RepID=A0ABP4GIX7_9MICO
MGTSSNWARGSNQYLKRTRPEILTRADNIHLSPSSAADRLELTGITWDSTALDFGTLKQSTPDRARARYRAMMPEYIWDAAALEGNPYTLPEVRTLLEGITVSGHRLDDQEQILALNEGFNLVDTLVGDSRFLLDKNTSDTIHGLVARHEAIESGAFRGQGAAGGGGRVGLGERGVYQASDPGVDGATLIAEHKDLLDYLDTLTDPRERAFAYFAAATKRQFYFDGNKRTSRLMMAGELMANGYDAVSVSATRRLEYNTYLTELFVTHDATQLMRFIIDNRPSD